MNELPQRKRNRLPCYDYSTPHPYFITVCTADKRCVLGRVAGQSNAIPQAGEQCSPLRGKHEVSNVGESNALPPHVELSSWGKTVDKAIREIPERYPMIRLDKYVVMPNHLHMILFIEESEAKLPDISHVIQQMKGAVTKQLGVSIWQKSFHDHVIRGEADYREIWEYVDNNPLKWTLDRYYAEQ